MMAPLMRDASGIVMRAVRGYHGGLMLQQMQCARVGCGGGVGSCVERGQMKCTIEKQARVVHDFD